jgi:hypothetical protein
MCGDIATPNLYAVSQRNCLQALGTRMTIMCRRSGSSSSNDDVERADAMGLGGVGERRVHAAVQRGMQSDGPHASARLSMAAPV